MSSSPQDARSEKIDALRAAMVDTLLTGGHVSSASIGRAMSQVERHRFVPEVPVVEAYAPHDAVIIKRGHDGAALSSASGPDIVAAMLELLEVAPGHRVLEIGTGTGYNAALLAELVGDHGRVVTVDLHGDIIERARRALVHHGYEHVVALTQDGTVPVAGEKPFDRIIVTAGAWDIPPAWIQQLRPDGRLVLPLRWRGQSQIVALHATPRPPGKTAEQDLTGTAEGRCEFITLVGAHGEQTVPLDHEGRLSLSFDVDQDIRPELLTAAFDDEPEHRWSGITVDRRAPVDEFWIHLSAREPGTCRVAPGNTSTRAQQPTRMHPAPAPALVEGSSLSYLTARPASSTSTTSEDELGAVGFGPHGAQLAQRIVAHLQDWSGGHAPRPDLTVQLLGSLPPAVGASAITKTHCSLSLRT